MSDLGHYAPLYAGYFSAMLGCLVLIRFDPGLWAPSEAAEIKRPWIEFAALLAVGTGIVAIGTLAASKMSSGRNDVLGDIIDIGIELLRFAPLIMFYGIVRPPAESAWVRLNRLHVRLGIGLGLAALALLVFSMASGRIHDPLSLLTDIGAGLQERGLRPAPLAVHVLLEDLIVAALASRLVAVSGKPIIAAAIVAMLFSVGHLPGLVQEGLQVTELISMGLDMMLGVAAILLLHRTRDVAWFWCLHFAMDMTQFAG